MDDKTTEGTLTRRAFLAAAGGAAAALLLPEPLVAGPARTPAPPVPAEEWRGVWISRFEWTSGSGDDVSGRLARMMRSLAQGNFNAVVFQVRGQGDTLYPSSIEPWSPMLSASARAIDPASVAIREARRNGLQFHAWLNLLVVWQSREKRPPTDPRHPFFRFANPSDPARATGVVRDAARRPITYGDSDYTWLSPGNPEVEAYCRAVVLDFIRRHQVDGLHWDDRTAMPHGASHDPVSLERWKGRGNPMGLGDLREWQRDQLSRMLSNIHAAATAEQPRLLVSASPFGIYDKNRVPGYGRFKDCVHDFNTDGEAWLRDGIIDALMPQIYWKDGGRAPDFSTLARDWNDHNRSGRPVWPGSALGDYGGLQPLRGVQESYVRLARQLRMGGNTFFSYSAAPDAEWASARGFLYPSKAAVPVPPLRKAPQTGQVLGLVRDRSGRPLRDVWVSLEGRRYVHLSAADGFYAIPSVPPGTRKIVFDAGNGQRVERTVPVRRGAAVRVDITG
ncbi:MAG: family 10 glycosylhydrolase [Candidatus Sumerlaeia bacterium]|nr:family 10 glycosylhydrolase [Candidatus Sumerlaeia bacterium]